MNLRGVMPNGVSKKSEINKQGLCWEKKKRRKSINYARLFVVRSLTHTAEKKISAKLPQFEWRPFEDESSLSIVGWCLRLQLCHALLIEWNGRRRRKLPINELLMRGKFRLTTIKMIIQFLTASLCRSLIITQAKLFSHKPENRKAVFDLRNACFVSENRRMS